MLHAYESGTLWPSDKDRVSPITANPVKIRFHNDSGEAIPRFAVMRITGVNNSGSAPWRVKVGKPNDTFYNLYLVNSEVRCAVSGNGWGTFLFNSGHVLCDSTYTPTAGQEWGPTSGSWSLVRHRPGFLIDGGPAGSGATYRAVAKQRMVTILRGITTSELVEQGSCTVNLRLRNSATGLREATGITVTAYDDFLEPGGSWPVSTRVLIDFEGGVWNVIQASCEPDTGGGGGGSSPPIQSGGHLGVPGLYPSGYEPGSGNEFSGSSEWSDYDSLLSSRSPR